jgi:hypothetical protein
VGDIEELAGKARRPSLRNLHQFHQLVRLLGEITPNAVVRSDRQDEQSASFSEALQDTAIEQVADGLPSRQNEGYEGAAH